MKNKTISFFVIALVLIVPSMSANGTLAADYTVNTESQCSNPTLTLYITGGPGTKYNVSTLKAPENTCVTISFHNADPSTVHTFTINAVSSDNVTYFNIYVSAGQTNSSNFWTPNMNKDYKFYCAIPGHDVNGMNGTLIIGTGSQSSPGFSIYSLLLGIFITYGFMRYSKRKKNTN